MNEYTFNASATVSCWTTVKADTLEEARDIAEGRELSGLCHNPYTGGDDQGWHFSNDGEPFDIETDE